MRPFSTSEYFAPRAYFGERRGISGRSIQTWAPSLASSWNSDARRLGSRWATTFVEQQQRGDAGHFRYQVACASTSPDQQRLLLAGRGIARRHVLRRVDHFQVGQMRAVERAPGGGVAGAAVCAGSRGSGPRRTSRGSCISAFSIQPSSMMSAEGKGGPRRRAPAASRRVLSGSGRASPPPQPQARRFRVRSRRTNERRNCVPPAGDCATAGERSSADTRAECSLSIASTSRSKKRRRSDAAPVNRPSHRRRQPHHAQMIAEGGRRTPRARGRSGQRRLVAAASLPGGSMPVPSVASPSAPSTSAETAQETVALDVGDVVQRRPAQPRVPATETRLPSMQLVLRRRSAPPAPPHPRASRGPPPIIAEMGQAEAMNAGGGHVSQGMGQARAVFLPSSLVGEGGADEVRRRVRGILRLTSLARMSSKTLFGCCKHIIVPVARDLEPLRDQDCFAGLIAF